MAGHHGSDGLDRVRTTLSDLDYQPIGTHVGVIGAALDAIVSELDDLSRTIPPAR